MARILKYDTIDSANREAMELALAGEPEGTVVLAGTQTAGRGRFGRVWNSVPGDGVYYSVVLRPQLPPEHIGMLTPVMACSIARCIPQAMIKWPNDLVIGSRKLGGILAEFRAGDPCYVVIGAGVNLNHIVMPAPHATSLTEHTGLHYDPETECRRYMEAFEADYAQVCEAGSLKPLKEFYESRLVNLGRKVKVLDPKGEYEGTATGTDRWGRLLVDGRTVDSGEVSVRGICGYV